VLFNIPFLAETATQDLVSVVPWTFIAQICNLFIQMLLIKKFLFKPIREMLAKRQELADEKLRVAEADKTAAEELKATYEKNMEQARDKANELLASAQKTAASQSDEIIRAANEQAVAIKSKAEADIAQERRKAVNELKGEIGSMAMEIAGKVIEREISEKDHAKLIDEFIENVGKA
jgi:F-type H+-transporting ATPase subunit b